jgi:hypothetical protein
MQLIPVLLSFSTFFQKFALILFMTIVQATIGSFVVFLTMTDCIGPNHPTYLVDRLTSSCRSGKSDNANLSTEEKESMKDKTELASVSIRLDSNIAEN